MSQSIKRSQPQLSHILMISNLDWRQYTTQYWKYWTGVTQQTTARDCLGVVIKLLKGC